MQENPKWLDWAMRLQSLAQAGLFYSKDVFDQERYQEIRDIAAEMMSEQTDVPFPKMKELFCHEVGYQTPKLDTRAAIFREDKILLVKEKSGTWSLPGGWVDANLSIEENTIKEVKEEAGIDVKADSIIAIQDRAKHNQPIYPYGVCKVFVACTYLSGHFESNSETSESAYFSENQLPQLATEKNTAEQISMCFAAYRDPNWKTQFD